MGRFGGVPGQIPGKPPPPQFRVARSTPLLPKVTEQSPHDPLAQVLQRAQHFGDADAACQPDRISLKSATTRTMLWPRARRIHQMIVAVHQASRVTHPAEIPRHLPQQFQKTLPVGVIFIDGLAAIATRDRVVEGAGEFETDGRSHVGMATGVGCINAGPAPLLRLADL